MITPINQPSQLVNLYMLCIIIIYIQLTKKKKSFVAFGMHGLFDYVLRH